jgi:hypothetical protein
MLKKLNQSGNIQKKEKNIKIDIVEKNIEIKPDKIDLDIVFLDAELSAFF